MQACRQVNTGKHTGNHTDRRAYRQRHIEAGKQVGKQTSRQSYRRASIQVLLVVGRQTYVHTGKPSGSYSGKQ